MPSNQRLLLHALRMLVLAIVLVLAPARTAACEYSAAEVPMLVLRVGTTGPMRTPPRVATPHPPVSDATDRGQPPPQPLVRYRAANADLVRVFARYLTHCSLLC